MPQENTDSTRTSDIVIVGSYVQDHVWLTDRFPNVGETRRALGFTTGPGGKGFNQAVSCARQQGRAAFIGAIGDDALGVGAQRFASIEGINAHWLVRDDVPTAAAGITVDRHGANEIMVNLAANEHLDPEFLRAQEPIFKTARVLLVQLENNIDAVRCALEMGTSHDLIRVMNPAPVHSDLDAKLLELCDLITPNETELTLLLSQVAGETLSSDAVANSSDETLHRLCRHLGAASVIVTLGAAGCFVSHGESTRFVDDQPYYRVAAESVKAIDTTGAGDAFNGALVAAIARDMQKPLRDAVISAGRVAALSTEKLGAALAMPTAADVRARFA